MQLQHVDIRTFELALPDPDSVGRPSMYITDGFDTSNNWKVIFYPTPDAAMNIDFKYFKLITELANATDEPIFPSKWHQILIFGALAFYGGHYIDDSRRNLWLNDYESMLEKMRRSYSPISDRTVVIRPWDRRIRSRGSESVPPLFPAEFGRGGLL